MFFPNFVSNLCKKIVMRKKEINCTMQLHQNMMVLTMRMC